MGIRQFSFCIQLRMPHGFSVSVQTEDSFSTLLTKTVRHLCLSQLYPSLWPAHSPSYPDSVHFPKSHSAMPCILPIFSSSAWPECASHFWWSLPYSALVHCYHLVTITHVTMLLLCSVCVLKIELSESKWNAFASLVIRANIKKDIQFFIKEFLKKNNMLGETLGLRYTHWARCSRDSGQMRQATNKFHLFLIFS